MKIMRLSCLPVSKVVDQILDELSILLELSKKNNSSSITHLEDYFVYKNNLCLMFKEYNGKDLETYLLERNSNDNPLSLVEKRNLCKLLLRGIAEIKNG